MIFTFHGSDGRTPNGVIQGSDGNFYGTTRYDGPAGGGTAFKLTPGGTLTTLYRFSYFWPDRRLADGTSHLKGSDGNFYGTTSRRWHDYASMEHFSRSRPAARLTTLHNFGEDFDDTDGTNPQATLLLGSDGNFYGTHDGWRSRRSEAPYSSSHPTDLSLLHSFNVTIGNGQKAPSPREV